MKIITNAPDAKIWACEWTGPRGGRWWTGWMTEEKAREKFEEIGEKGPAKLIRITAHSDQFGTMKERVEENLTMQLQWLESILKDDLKRRAKLNKTIEHNREKIGRLKANIRKVKL